MYAGGVFTAFTDPAASGYAEVAGINDAGQVVGSYQDAAGGFHSFLATPNAAPEPPALAGLALGVLGLAGLGRRARCRPA